MDLRTVRDMFQKRDRMLHEHALWTEMHDYLNKFLDGDAKPASIGISSKGTGGVVPQDIIMEAQLQIDATLEGLQREIEALEKTEIPQNEPAATKESKDPAPSDSKGSNDGKAAHPAQPAKSGKSKQSS